MNTRCSLSAIVTAFVVACAALVLAPSAGYSQAIDCSQCDHFTFAASANLNCAITVCYALSPGGPALCRIIPPGRSITIPCPVSQLWVSTCSGPYYIVPAAVDALCSPILKFAADCCGRICVTPSIDLCTRIEAQPTPCASAGCP